MLGVLSAGFPTRALSLAVAAAVLTTTLTIVPISSSVPVLGNSNDQADAHRRTNCWQQQQGTVMRRARENGEWVTREVPRYVTVCINVEHSHWWRPVITTVTSWWACSTFTGAVAGAGAGPAGVGVAIAGCAVAVGAAEAAGQ